MGSCRMEIGCGLVPKIVGNVIKIYIFRYLMKIFSDFICSGVKLLSTFWATKSQTLFIFGGNIVAREASIDRKRKVCRGRSIT